MSEPTALHPEATVVQEVRNDSWANPQSGMGMPGADPRTAWVPYARHRNQQHMRDLWLGDGLAGRIVEHPAEEMTRERGRVVLGEGYEAAQEQLSADMDELDVWTRFCQALKYDNAYGGGGNVLALDDGMPWSQPVDVARLVRVQAIHHATPDELRAVEYFTDETHTQHGKPALYEWRPVSRPGASWGVTSRLVHASRVIAFTGLAVDDQRMVYNGGWGDSMLARCEERIRDTASALAGAGVALQNFSQDVITSPAMLGLLGDKKGRAELEARMLNFRLTRSMLGAWLMGKDETYTRHGIPMTGVADTLHELAAFLCATTGMPMSVLMGYAEAGLGDAGASQRRIWHDKVASMQATRLRPAMNRLIRLMLLAKRGPTQGVEPKGWMLEFNPLDKPTTAEEDARQKLFADIDKAYVDMQARRPEHIAKYRFSGSEGFNPTLPPDPYMEQGLPPYEEPTPGAEGAPGAEPVETAPLAAAPAGEVPPAAPAPADGSVADTALNGAQITSLFEGLKLAASGQLDRKAVVEALALALNRPVARLERVVGSLGAGFVPTPEGTPAPGAPRADAEAWAALLVREARHGGLTPEEVERKVAKLYGVRPRQTRALMKRLGTWRADAAGVTNFPRPGSNKSVGLKASRFRVFDVAYAQDLRENWPEVWALSSLPLGEKQFERLLPLARAGGAASSDMETHAVRLCEEWAKRNATKERTAGVVAQVKWLVVGKAGEAAMKSTLEKAKDKARRARAASGK